MASTRTTTPDGDQVRIAVIGEFQIGKSTLINGILGSRSAQAGNGWRPQTDRHADYMASCDVVVVDTPGVNDRAEREKETRDAVKAAHCVVYVRNNVQRGLGELDTKWIELARDEGKPCAFVLNCMPKAEDEDYGPDVENSWNPQSELNIGWCGKIHDFVKDGCGEIYLPIGECGVLPINAHWALYGQGLLKNSVDVAEVEKSVRKLMGDGDGLLPNEELRSWAFAHSNICALRDFIGSIRLELLSHFLRNKDLVIQKMADAFCTEFAKRLTSREGR